MATLETRNLSTGYITSGHRRTVVTGLINATLHPGQLTCLLGPNGAGKSTLLRTLAGFQPPLEGQILIDGSPLGSFTPPQLARTIGVVLTDRVSLANMSVRELVSLGRSPYTGFWGRLSADDLAVVDHAIALVGIGPLAARPVSGLSDGERQKTMIAKALAQQTPVIYLDEPTAFLDFPSKVEMLLLLRRLAREEGKTVFLSTHDVELALQVADTLWLIDKRLGVATGEPSALARGGVIARYFEREGVMFDARAGVFRITSGHKKATPEQDDETPNDRI